MSIVTVDNQGRIFLPQQTREALSIKPGDELVVEQEGDRIAVYDFETFVLKRAAEAEEEFRAGKTIPLRQLMEEDGVDPDAVDDDIIIY